MTDRQKLLTVLALAAFTAITIWFLWSDVWLKHDCASVHGTWDAQDRTCNLRAGPMRHVVIAAPTAGG